MKATLQVAGLAVALLVAASLKAQTPPAASSNVPDASVKEPWAFSLTTDGYVVPHEEGYVSPTFTADRNWVHLEARYNYEDLRTASMWVGYNFSAGKNLVFNITPMIGGVFGRINGIAPGCELSLTYKKIELSMSNEYVFDTTSKLGNFYYSWPQLTYSPLNWLRIGLVAQHTEAYQTSLNVQRGFLVGVSYKKAEFTTYIFNVGWTDPTVVYELGLNF